MDNKELVEKLKQIIEKAKNKPTIQIFVGYGKNYKNKEICQN